MNPVQKLSFSDLTTEMKAPIDVFVCSASYEERSYMVANALCESWTVRHSLIFHDKRLTLPAQKHLTTLEDVFHGRAARVALDRFDPVKTADKLQAALSRVVQGVGPRRYLVDITTFTHEALLILLSILRRFVSHRDVVCVVYTAADEYSIGLPPEKKWLSKGVRDIRSVLGYPGTITPSRRSHLIVLVGFEADRALELIESYEPNVLSLGFGEEASAVGPHHQAINRLAFRQIASKVIHYTEFNFSATSPFDAEIALKEQIKLRPDCNVLVAPMNTKLSTIGAAAVAFRDDNIRLCYASAMTYNVDNYSRAADYCYLTNIPFDFWRWPERKTATSDISIAKLWTKGANRVAEFVH